MSARANHIYHASSSPRRRELLEQIGVDYQPLAVDVPEELLAGETPEVFALRLAVAKARAGRALLADDDPVPVLGADTVVVQDERVLGKPRNKVEGLAMLSQLSASTHQVYTAVALMGADGQVASRLSVNNVSFRATSHEERDAYWNTGEPGDKAGGYGIQGKAAVFIERLEGSYSGVMGLPLFETAELLALFDVKVP
jgi:septum formation protein